jgi:hypothetical protein
VLQLAGWLIRSSWAALSAHVHVVEIERRDAVEFEEERTSEGRRT